MNRWLFYIYTFNCIENQVFWLRELLNKMICIYKSMLDVWGEEDNQNVLVRFVVQVKGNVIWSV